MSVVLVLGGVETLSSPYSLFEVFTDRYTLRIHERSLCDVEIALVFCYGSDVVGPWFDFRIVPGGVRCDVLCWKQLFGQYSGNGCGAGDQWVYGGGFRGHRFDLGFDHLVRGSYPREQVLYHLAKDI